MATKNYETWMVSHWRSGMAWMYTTVCIFDFIIAPVLWSILQVNSHGVVTDQWKPLTLESSGLFHVAMGGVLGVSSWGRTREKINTNDTPK